MTTSKNIQAQESQYVEGVRMLFKGLSMMFGTVADGMEAGVPAARAVDTSVPHATPTAPAQAETKAPAPAETAANAEGKKITRTDVQRAMAAKIKELSAKGSSPDAVGTLFPQFHGASCVSDLTADDYPAFLAELAKL